jgi:hypothetical protein
VADLERSQSNPGGYILIYITCSGRTAKEPSLALIIVMSLSGVSIGKLNDPLVSHLVDKSSAV